MHKFNENAVEILKKRYLLRDEKGNFLEDPDGMLKRVAVAVAAAEKDLDLAARYSNIFYHMMADLDFLPNSPTLMNAGTEDPQCCACFVTKVVDSIDGIFTNLHDWAKIFKSGGGVGANFSRLRPENDHVRSTSGVSSGPISFMSVYDKMVDVLKAGGRRRGAAMGVLNCDHPDIIKFVKSKHVDKTLSNFNISVGITDSFMEAVKNDGSWELKHPHSDQGATTIRARELFDLIVDQAWHNGEPGVLFLDTINVANPTPELGNIDSTNPYIPCGVQG